MNNIMRVGLSVTSVLVRRGRDTRESFLCENPEERPCEDTGRRQLASSQEQSSHQKPTLAPGSWVSGPRTVRKSACVV